MIPGYELEKDPKAWVVAGSEDCYLFVKLEKSQNFDTYLKYDIADDWKLVPGETNVYYRIVTSEQMSSDNGATNAYSILAGDKVTVSGDITKEQMNALDTEGAEKPTLKITAYASQLHKNATETFSPSDAWDNIANK